MAYHHKDEDTGQRVTEKQTERTRVRQRLANTKEQTRSDGTAESDELNVARFQSRILSVNHTSSVSYND